MSAIESYPQFLSKISSKLTYKLCLNSYFIFIYS